MMFLALFWWLHPKKTDPPAGRESLQVMRNVGTFLERKKRYVGQKKASYDQNMDNIWIIYG